MFPLMNVAQEKPLDWVFRRKRKTHFHRPGKSSPSNNTELLYNGSVEAREILSNALNLAYEDHEDIAHTTAGSLSSVCILETALDYLKGRDIQGRFSYTADFFGPTLAEWTEQLLTESETEKPELVQIYPMQNQEPAKDKPDESETASC
jgi:hypothetical protein